MIILIAKSQLGLFDKLVPVAGSVSKDGTVTAPHMAIRHVRPPAAKPPAHHAHAAYTGDLFDSAPKPHTTQEPVKKPVETEHVAAPKPDVAGERHTYGLTMRAADASALPEGYIAGSHRESGKYKFGTADFSRKLSADDVDRFDLVDISAVKDQAARDQKIQARIDKNPALAEMVSGSGVALGDIDDDLLDTLEAELAGEKANAQPDTSADISPDIPPAKIVGKVNYDGPFDPDTIPDFGVAAGTSKEARRQINSTAAALSVLTRGHMTDADLSTLRQYSGNGGCGDSLNEFYTDPKVAAAMWNVLHGLGIREGEVLEPSCATGVFMETAPSGIRVQGVELDSTSARIASLLHPMHGIENASLEGFATNDQRQFDAVVGNAPFGLRGGLIKQDKPDLKTAEGYFLDTSLDKLREGGVMAMIVPTGVMDSKRDRKLRERLLRKGEFLGGLRMPNTAFEHSHTGVTTDVLFFRKRPEEVAAALAAVDQTTLKKLGVWDEEYLSGAYFEERGAPNVLGTMEPGWRAKAGMGDDITVEGSMVGVPEAIATFEPETPERAGPTMEEILAAVPDEDAREKVRGASLRRPYSLSKRGDTKTVDGVQYILEGEPLRWHRVDDFLGSKAVADAVSLAADIERAMTDDGYADASGLAERVKAYVEEHGVPSKNLDLKVAAGRDRQLYRLIGAVKPDGTISDLVAGKKAEAVEGSFDAAAATLALEQGEFTATQVAGRWHGGDAETALDHLYASPEYALTTDGLWTSQDNYLSGEMWPKLDAVKAALEGDDLKPEDRAKYERQAKLLEDTIDPRSLEDVELQVNTAFLPLDVVADFFNSRRPTTGYGANAAPLEITFDAGVYALKNSTYYESLLGKYLNRTGVRKDDDMPTIDQWNADFKVWVCGSKHRDAVEDLYNRSFRGFRQREYSNTPFEVPGLNADGLKDYQWSGLRRAMADGKGIVAADVGLGKTVRGLMLARMMKVTGRAQRPMIVVPKTVMANWAAEAEKWFPGSTVLTIGETYSRDKAGNLKGKQDSAAERNRKLHDLTQNEYDFILISQPAWNDLDLDPATKRSYADDDFWVQRGDALGNAGDKRLNKIREAHDQQMAGRDFQRRTDAIYFNDLGVDAIIADEMHAFKNLYAAKNRFGQQPKFLGGQGLSNRALDMSFKSRWVRDNNGGLNVYGLTATPTKNSPLEIYSMLSHIAPEAFERIGIRNSEEFLDRFCEFREENILTTGGDIDRALVTVGFKNLNELREIMLRYIDRKTAEDVGLVLPARDDRQHLVEMSAQQKEVYVELREKALEAKGKDATGDAHIFSIMDKMGKAALDLEMYDPVAYAGASSPKYVAAAGQIAAGVTEGGQVVFCDSIGAHEKMASALVAAGIPRDQIGIINAQVAASSTSRQNIADAFNSGKLKVVIGNTATMGEGINLQKGTTDIHHLDLPWEPASMQQRNGRGLRQGNLKESVRIHTYLAKGSFDGYRHQSMRAKKDWQDLLWNGGDRVENLAREGAMSRDDLMVMLAADPDAARTQLAANREAAQAQFNAQQTTQAVEDFAKMREMRRSLASLKNKDTPAAERLRVRTDRMRLALADNPFFKAKEALDSNEPMLVQPQTGELFKVGTAFEVEPDAGALHGGGKFVVTGIEKHASLGDLVSLRRFGSTAKAGMKAQLSDLANGVKPFQYDAGAEEAEMATAFASGASEVLADLKGYSALRGLPSKVIEGSYAAIQKAAKDGLRDHKFSIRAGYGDIGLISEGKPVLHSSYEAKNHLDTHDLLLPTDDHREKVMSAFLEAERAKTYAYEYRAGNRRGSTSDEEFKVKYQDGRGYSNQSTNPWGKVGDEVFGAGFAKDARSRFDREQQHAAAKANTLTESIAALAPTIEASSYGGADVPKKTLAMMWAKARRTGVLDEVMAAHVPAGRSYGGLFDEWIGYGQRPVKLGQRTVRQALLGMAKNRHPDLAAAMMAGHDNPEVAVRDMLDLKDARAIKQGVTHLVGKHPRLADRVLSEFGPIQGARPPRYYGGVTEPAHPLHTRYGDASMTMTLGQLAANDEDDRDAA